MKKKRSGVSPDTATPTQRAYLNFIREYVALHRQAPAETDMQAFFRVSAPSVHRMVMALAEKGLISKVPGQARSIRLVDPHADVEDQRPTRPPDEITAPLDPEIASLVYALGADPLVLTKGSCWGHGKKLAYVDLAVDGLPGLRHFVERLNQIDRKLADEALIDVTLNWSQEVVTACAFDLFPNWIMLSLRIEGPGRGGAPTAALLSKIAKLWRP